MNRIIPTCYGRGGMIGGGTARTRTRTRSVLNPMTGNANRRYVSTVPQSLTSGQDPNFDSLVLRSRSYSHLHRSGRQRNFSSFVKNIEITRSSPTTVPGNSSTIDLEKEELTAYIDDLLLRTRSLMDDNETPRNDEERGGPNTLETNSVSKSAHHVIAFSGGIDSSVTAALVHKVAASVPSNVYGSETVTAVLGLSPAVPIDQRKLAQDVASAIGVPLEQISTTEGTDAVYVANDGRACLACKTHLYDNLKSIATTYCNSSTTPTTTTTTTIDTILYNGTNADDLKDPTRLGLIAASDFSVRSPLSSLPKDRVRAVGRHLGLPNWDYAASPCLRSRLAVGVMATPHHLRGVEDAEAFVKTAVGKRLHANGQWDVRKNLRVRILSKNRAMIEVDDDSILMFIQGHLTTESWKTYFEDDLGFASVGVRRFKTGSVAPQPNRIATIAAPSGVRKLRRRP